MGENAMTRYVPCRIIETLPPKGTDSNAAAASALATVARTAPPQHRPLCPHPRPARPSRRNKAITSVIQTLVDRAYAHQTDPAGTLLNAVC